MTVEKKITISLAEKDVKEIVVDYLAKEGYKVNLADVALVVENRWTGYGRDERQVPYFKECTAVVRGE